MAEILPHDINWAEIEAGWQLERELRSPPPRRVVPQTGPVGFSGRAMGCFLGGAMLSMFSLGLLLSLLAGLALLILPLGVNTPGVVTRHEISNGPRSRTQNYFLHFRFAWKQKTYAGEWPVSASTYTRLRDGAKVTVRCFPFAPGLRPLIEEGGSPWFNVWALGPLGLLMLVISGFYLLAVLTPRRGKRLVQQGEATAAIITRRQSDENAATGGEITFLYRAGQQSREKTMRYGGREEAVFAVGQVLTVLFEPRRPDRARLYRCCDFRAQE